MTAGERDVLGREVTFQVSFGPAAGGAPRTATIAGHPRTWDVTLTADRAYELRDAVTGSVIRLSTKGDLLGARLAHRLPDGTGLGFTEIAADGTGVWRDASRPTASQRLRLVTADNGGYALMDRHGLWRAFDADGRLTHLGLRSLDGKPVGTVALRGETAVIAGRQWRATFYSDRSLELADAGSSLVAAVDGTLIRARLAVTGPGGSALGDLVLRADGTATALGGDWRTTRFAADGSVRVSAGADWARFGADGRLIEGRLGGLELRRDGSAVWHHPGGGTTTGLTVTPSAGGAGYRLAGADGTVIDVGPRGELTGFDVRHGSAAGAHGARFDTPADGRLAGFTARHPEDGRGLFTVRLGDSAQSGAVPASALGREWRATVGEDGTITLTAARDGGDRLVFTADGVLNEGRLQTSAGQVLIGVDGRASAAGSERRWRFGVDADGSLRLAGGGNWQRYSPDGQLLEARLWTSARRAELGADGHAALHHPDGSTTAALSYTVRPGGGYRLTRADGARIDLDADGRLVGLDITEAGRRGRLTVAAGEGSGPAPATLRRADGTTLDGLDHEPTPSGGHRLTRTDGAETTYLLYGADGALRLELRASSRTGAGTTPGRTWAHVSASAKGFTLADGGSWMIFAADGRLTSAGFELPIGRLEVDELGTAVLRHGDGTVTKDLTYTAQPADGGFQLTRRDGSRILVNAQNEIVGLDVTYAGARHHVHLDPDRPGTAVLRDGREVVADRLTHTVHADGGHSFTGTAGNSAVHLHFDAAGELRLALRFDPRTRAIRVPGWSGTVTPDASAVIVATGRGELAFAMADGRIVGGWLEHGAGWLDIGEGGKAVLRSGDGTALADNLTVTVTTRPDGWGYRVASATGSRLDFGADGVLTGLDVPVGAGRHRVSADQDGQARVFVLDDKEQVVRTVEGLSVTRHADGGHTFARPDGTEAFHHAPDGGLRAHVAQDDASRAWRLTGAAGFGTRTFAEADVRLLDGGAREFADGELRIVLGPDGQPTALRNIPLRSPVSGNDDLLLSASRDAGTGELVVVLRRDRPSAFMQPPVVVDGLRAGWAGDHVRVEVMAGQRHAGDFRRYDLNGNLYYEEVSKLATRGGQTDHVFGIDYATNAWVLGRREGGTLVRLPVGELTVRSWPNGLPPGAAAYGTEGRVEAGRAGELRLVGPHAKDRPATVYVRERLSNGNLLEVFGKPAGRHYWFEWQSTARGLFDHEARRGVRTFDEIATGMWWDRTLTWGVPTGPRVREYLNIDPVAGGGMVRAEKIGDDWLWYRFDGNGELVAQGRRMRPRPSSWADHLGDTAADPIAQRYQGWLATHKDAWSYRVAELTSDGELTGRVHQFSAQAELTKARESLPGGHTLVLERYSEQRPLRAIWMPPEYLDHLGERLFARAFGKKYGTVDFPDPAADRFFPWRTTEGDNRYRVYRWVEYDAQGIPVDTGLRRLRLRTDGTFTEYTYDGHFLRGTWKQDNGNLLEVGRARPAAAGEVSTQWERLGDAPRSGPRDLYWQELAIVGGEKKLVASGIRRLPGDSPHWVDLVDEGGAQVVVRQTIGDDGRIITFLPGHRPGYDPALPPGTPHAATNREQLGTITITRDQMGEIVARTEAWPVRGADGRQVVVTVSGQGNPNRGAWAWRLDQPEVAIRVRVNGEDLIVPGDQFAGTRISARNRRPIGLADERFADYYDDSFRDYVRVSVNSAGRQSDVWVLVRESRALDAGATLRAFPGENGWQSMRFDGDGRPVAGSAAAREFHRRGGGWGPEPETGLFGLPSRAPVWRDLVVDGGQARVVRETVQGRVLEYVPASPGLTAGRPLDRPPGFGTWQEYDQGVVFRERRQVEPGLYREVDKWFTGQWRETDEAGRLLRWRSLSGRVWERGPLGPWRLSLTRVQPLLVGREMDYRGLLNEIRGWRRIHTYVSMREYRAVDGLVGTFIPRPALVGRRLTWDFYQEVFIDFTARTAAEWAISAESGQPWANPFTDAHTFWKTLVNSVVSAGIGQVSTALHLFGRGGRLRLGMGNIDNGFPRNRHIPRDDWETEFAGNEYPPRWRGITYDAIETGLVVAPLSSYATNWLIGEIHEPWQWAEPMDAFYSTLVTGSVFGTMRRGLHSYMSGRFFHIGGLAELADLAIERTVDRTLSRWVREELLAREEEQDSSSPPPSVPEPPPASPSSPPSPPPPPPTAPAPLSPSPRSVPTPAPNPPVLPARTAASQEAALELVRSSPPDIVPTPSTGREAAPSSGPAEAPSSGPVSAAAPASPAPPPAVSDLLADLRPAPAAAPAAMVAPPAEPAQDDPRKESALALVE
ncbi:MAG: hypothetical protein IRZ08_06780 [Frankia sp.]|nr:hypothetical protein [Frankia sp.]